MDISMSASHFSTPRNYIPGMSVKEVWIFFITLKFYYLCIKTSLKFMVFKHTTFPCSINHLVIFPSFSGQFQNPRFYLTHLPHSYLTLLTSKSFMSMAFQPPKLMAASLSLSKPKLFLLWYNNNGIITCPQCLYLHFSHSVSPSVYVLFFFLFKTSSSWNLPFFPISLPAFWLCFLFLSILDITVHQFQPLIQSIA